MDRESGYRGRHHPSGGRRAADHRVGIADGVYAIAVTLLAVELILPEAAAELHRPAR